MVVFIRYAPAILEIRECVAKALIDLKSELRVTESQNYVVACLLQGQEPVHTVVLMLCAENVT